MCYIIIQHYQNCHETKKECNRDNHSCHSWFLQFLQGLRNLPEHEASSRREATTPIWPAVVECKSMGCIMIVSRQLTWAVHNSSYILHNAFSMITLIIIAYTSCMCRSRRRGAVAVNVRLVAPPPSDFHVGGRAFHFW